MYFFFFFAFEFSLTVGFAISSLELKWIALVSDFMATWLSQKLELLRVWNFIITLLFLKKAKLKVAHLALTLIFSFF